MQELRRKININGEDYHLAVSQHGSGPPAASALGKPGVLYLDTEASPERLYICTAANVEAGAYTWRPIEEMLKITVYGDTTVVPGEDGITPHIGENGNWYLGDIDTGVRAAGTDGDDGGYYSPEITPNEADNSFTITFKASKSEMPAVAPVTIKLPEKSNDSGENAAQGGSGVTAELKTALQAYFTNVQTLIGQTAYSVPNPVADIVISNARAVLDALEEQPEQPASGIIQSGSILAITSGVTVNQVGNELTIE